MMRFPLILITFGLTALVSAQSAPATGKAASEAATAAAANKEKFAESLQKVQSLITRQHYFDAMQELDKAEALSPGNPILPNVRGSIYTATRDFEKAKVAFEEAHKLLPDAFEPQFNLAELSYVEGKYEAAEAAFSELLKKFPRLREEVRHLTQFKIIVCHLKLNHVPQAEEMVKAFTFMDDTPAYYFSKAAFSFQKGDTGDAQAWLGRARRIFKPAQNTPYLDTLMEGHWVENIAVVPPSNGSKSAEAPPAPDAATLPPSVPAKP